MRCKLHKGLVIHPNFRENLRKSEVRKSCDYFSVDSWKDIEAEAFAAGCSPSDLIHAIVEDWMDSHTEGREDAKRRTTSKLITAQRGERVCIKTDISPEHLDIIQKEASSRGITTVQMARSAVLSFLDAMARNDEKARECAQKAMPSRKRRRAANGESLRKLMLRLTPDEHDRLVHQAKSIDASKAETARCAYNWFFKLG